MICILWLHKGTLPPRDVYGGDSIAFAMMRVGDVFKYHDRYKQHDAHYIVSARSVEITGSRSVIELTCNECAPPEVVS